MLLVVLPFWTSFLIRVYAWVNILQHDGLLNQALIALRIIDAPVSWLATDSAVYIGIVYSYFPFMVLPLYAALEKMDETLLEAAADLGCPPWRAFLAVTVPLSLPGIVAGSLLCFIPIMGEFVIPDLLGSSSTAMIGQTLWLEFFGNRDWPVASALAVVLLVILLTPIMIYRQREARVLERAGCRVDARSERAETLSRLAQPHGARARARVPLSADRHPGDQFVQRLAPRHGVGRMVAALVSRAHAATRRCCEAASVSFRVAFLSASAATMLGTLAALALTRGAPLSRAACCSPA